MGSLRKIEVVLSVALLSVFLVGALRDWVSVTVVALVVSGVGVYLLLRAARPTVRRAWRAVRPKEGLAIELLPPPERYGPRDPVPFSALARAIEAAQLGTIERSEAGRLRLVTLEGEWLELSSSDPVATSLQNLRIESSSGDLAAFACDALVPRLGPLTFRENGIEVFIDGTLPRSELERELHDRRITRMNRLQHELKALEAEKQAPAATKYLN
ncbi:MAG: hypothetical protein IRZ16_20535 [Myxococcaceae bacterium]|nr:hypothetical protein [Myxococcaceae bacterium]